MFMFAGQRRLSRNSYILKVNKSRATVLALAMRVQTDIHRDVGPKIDCSRSDELRTCKSVRISRPNFFTIAKLSHTTCMTK
jgi:hypothetical protein